MAMVSAVFLAVSGATVALSQLTRSHGHLFGARTYHGKIGITLMIVILLQVGLGVLHFLGDVFLFLFTTSLIAPLASPRIYSLCV